ncbi:AN1-type zinc finger protein 4-like isoform X1 [Dreissena polymorpha]|nr:AN1-type zinc finger protein 4-like isoform X1 [Dreissena polymorpha]
MLFSKSYNTTLRDDGYLLVISGIPIAQQHLIWKSEELEDEYCLHDYRIHDGATLKLVLAMRGGPINTRRIPMEDPALREMAEYVEANRDEILEKLPGNRQVTLVVFREGDQLNFFRVVDRGDGTLTPLSESLSGVSMGNLYDEEEEEDAPSKEKVEENEQLKEKMKQIRLKMDKLNISKKPHRKPHPPSSGRASSRTSRLRHLPASTSYSLAGTSSLNRNLCLPPVGHTVGPMSHHSSFALRHSLLRDRMERREREEEKEKASAAFETSLAAVGGASKLASDSDDSDGGEPSYELDSLEQLTKVLSRVMDAGGYGVDNSNEEYPDLETVDEISSDIKETSGQDDHISDKPVDPGEHDKTVTEPAVSNCDKGSASKSPANAKRDLLRLGSQAEEGAVGGVSRPVTSTKIKDTSPDYVRESLRATPSSKGKSKIKDYSLFDSLRDTLGGSSSLSRHSSLDKRKEFTLESLSTSEARAMSGLLRQASLEKVGSSRIGNVTVTSASRNRVSGNYTLGSSTFPDARITTPEGRLMSARLQRMTASRDGRILSPTHRLPPVKAKKKATKRCFLCAKKTGLACSYVCRCGNNYCASHRYAESHDCTYDYKTEGRKLLEQNNPVVSAPKLPKI